MEIKQKNTKGRNSGIRGELTPPLGYERVYVHQEGQQLKGDLEPRLFPKDKENCEPQPGSQANLETGFATEEPWNV